MGCSLSRDVDVVLPDSAASEEHDRRRMPDLTEISITQLPGEPTTFRSAADLSIIHSLDLIAENSRLHGGRRPFLRRRVPDDERFRDLALQQNLQALEQALREDLEQFAETLLENIYAEAMDPNPEGCGPPPASQQEMTRLRRTPILREDLMRSSNNKHCVICCEPHSVGELVTRLPCAHFFHPHCVEAWLHRHCTCPTCRYELATDDGDYERGRIERMKVREELHVRPSRTDKLLLSSSPPRGLTACSTADESDECPSDEDQELRPAWEYYSSMDEPCAYENAQEGADATFGWRSSECDDDKEEERSMPSLENEREQSFFENHWASFEPTPGPSVLRNDLVRQTTTAGSSERTSSIALGDCYTPDDAARLDLPLHQADELFCSDGDPAALGEDRSQNLE